MASKPSRSLFCGRTVNGIVDSIQMMRNDEFDNTLVALHVYKKLHPYTPTCNHRNRELHLINRNQNILLQGKPFSHLRKHIFAN